KGVLVSFAQRMFWPEVQCRFRCDYFPFVEPGVEMSMQCPICRGSGCRVCKMSGWIELLGAGMVHPRVLRNVGYDPDEVNGIVIGRVAEIKRHEGADHLFVAQVDVRSEMLTLVTAAPNLRAGDVVPVVRAGGRLAPERVLEARRFRGVLSQGMMCSGEELGVS